MDANRLRQAAQVRVEALLNLEVFEFGFFSINIGHYFIANDHIIPSRQSLYAGDGVDSTTEEIQTIV